MNYKKMLSAARLLAGLAALMGVAGSAMAAGNTINAPGLGANSAWTVYAFGNAQAVSDAFRALANFAASSMFQSIVSMIAVIGVLGVGLSGGFNPAVARKFIGYVVGVFLVCYVFFGVSNDGPLVVNVEVIDTVDMTWKAPVTVPAVVGIPASVISSAGYKITQAIEASFAIPSELKMSNGAPFNLAASMLADASQARISDPALASSLAYYVQDCFTVGVAQGALSASTLVNSTNFLQDIKFDSKVIMVNTLLQAPKGTPGIVTCTDAWNLIKTAVDSSGSGAADFLKDASAWSRTPAVSVINAAADSTAQWATNNGVTDGGALIKQSAILSAFRGAYSQASIQTGNSEFLTGIAMSQATEAQRTSWITGAEVFNKTMGYIFAIIQVFVYAITPLVLCAALVPGLGLALLKNFAQILLWLAIWQPMLAIVNFIVISMQQADLGGALNNAGSYGFTLQNMGIITERTANLRAAASFVGTMVPALAWAMVKGSVDFSRVIGSAVGENFAQGAANTMATGNYSLNQASMDSFTANKHSTAATGAWGAGHNTNGAVGSQSYDLGGSSNIKVGENQAAVQVSATEGAQEAGNRGQGTQVGTTGSDLQSATASFMRALSASISAGGGFGLSSSSLTSDTLSGGLGGNFGLIQPNKMGPAGPVVPGTNIPSAQGGPAANPAQSGDTPASFGGKGQGRLRVDANANFNAAAVGQKAVVNNYNRNATTNDTATENNVAAHVKSGGITGSDTEQASLTTGYNKSVNQTIQGIPSTVARADQMAALLHMDNFMTQGKWGYKPPPNSAVANKTLAMNEPDAIPKAVAEEKQAVKDTRADLAGDVAKLKNGAVEQEKVFETDAKGALKRNTAEADATKAPAQRSAASRLVDAVGRGVGLLNDAKSQLEDRGIDVGKIASGEQRLADLTHPEGKPEGGKADGKPEGGKPDTKPEGGKPAPTAVGYDALKGAQPGGKSAVAPATAAGKPADEAHGGKPGEVAHGGKPGEPAQGGKPDGKGGKPATADGGKPDPKDPKAGNPNPDSEGPKAPGKGDLPSMKGSSVNPHHKQHRSPMEAFENGEAAHVKPEAGQPEGKGGQPAAKGGKPDGKPEGGKPEHPAGGKPDGHPTPGGGKPKGGRQPKTTQSQRMQEQHPGGAPKAPAHNAPEGKGGQPEVKGSAPEGKGAQPAGNGAEAGKPTPGGGEQHSAPQKGAKPVKGATSTTPTQTAPEGKQAPTKGGEPTENSQVGAQPTGANPTGTQPKAGETPKAEGGQPGTQARAEPQGNQPAADKKPVTPEEQQRQAQVDPRQQEAEMQQRQLLAAAASMAQALQAVAPPQPAPPPPPTVAPAVPEAPQLAAAEPPKMPQANDGAVPNPFSGEKEATNPQQMQGQVQLAEQRAERLESQRRNLDGVLASAEGRKPTELPGLINQARDILRS